MNLCSINTKPIGQNITVATPIGDSITCKKLVKDCPIVIRGRTLLGNLVIFKMFGLDIILGMDLLLEQYLSIDCWNNEVLFKQPGDEEFKFCILLVRATLPLPSTVQARRSIMESGQATFQNTIYIPLFKYFSTLLKIFS